MTATTQEYVVARIGDLRPTQVSLGHLEIFAKLGRHTLGKPHRTQPEIPKLKAAVRGPNDTIHLIDGHHTLTALAELDTAGPDHRVWVRIVADLSTLSEPEFYATLEKNGWSHIRDSHGIRLSSDDLPTTLALNAFHDDQLRSLIYFARGIGFRPTGVPFQEFHWAQWLRTSGIDLSDWMPESFSSGLRIVERITRAQAALPKDRILIGGRTPRELGVLDHWNHGRKRSAGTFGRLSRTYEHRRPGKLAYALEFAQLRSMAAPSAAPAPTTSPAHRHAH